MLEIGQKLPTAEELVATHLVAFAQQRRFDWNGHINADRAGRDQFERNIRPPSNP